MLQAGVDGRAAFLKRDPLYFNGYNAARNVKLQVCSYLISGLAVPD
jgi:hypothetical protein